jgi:hypothetical protein
MNAKSWKKDVKVGWEIKLEFYNPFVRKHNRSSAVFLFEDRWRSWLILCSKMGGKAGENTPSQNLGLPCLHVSEQSPSQYAAPVMSWPCSHGCLANFAITDVFTIITCLAGGVLAYDPRGHRCCLDYSVAGDLVVSLLQERARFVVVAWYPSCPTREESNAWLWTPCSYGIPFQQTAGVPKVTNICVGFAYLLCSPSCRFYITLPRFHYERQKS